MAILKWFVAFVVTVIVGAALIIGSAIYGQIKYNKGVAEAPGLLVDQFFTSITAGDFDTADNYFSPSATIDYVLNLDNKNYRRLFGRVKYTINNSTIEEDAAYIDITLTAPDFEFIFSNLIEQGLIMLDEGELTTNIERLTIKNTDTILKSRELPFVSTDLTLSLLMIDGKWNIVGNEELSNALLAGHLFNIQKWQDDLSKILNGQPPAQEIYEQESNDIPQNTQQPDSSAIIVPEAFIDSMILSLNNQDELNATLAVTLNAKMTTLKDETMLDENGNSSQDQVSFDFTYTNATEKDISSFICLIVFEDVEQGIRIAFNFTYSSMFLQANSSLMGTDLSFFVDETDNSQAWLRDVDESQLVMRVYPSSISFVDGSIIGQ